MADFRQWRRFIIIACQALNEPYTRVLQYPWDEILLCIQEYQELQRDEGSGAIIQLLQRLKQ